MAELTTTTGKQSSRHHTKKIPVRVDLTAMVDLAFLLITFFMLTTSLMKHKAMEVNMPVGPSEAVPETGTMTICLGKGNQAMWYLGMAEKPIIAPTLARYGRDLRTAIIETGKRVKASSGKDLNVVLKPSDHSVYENLVDALDEMNITKVPSYAIAKITQKDIDLLTVHKIY